MRAARSAGALIVVCLLVAGVPWALNRFGSAGDLLTVDWSSVLTAPIGSDLVLALLSAVGWLAWAFITAALAWSSWPSPPGSASACGSRHRMVAAADRDTGGGRRRIPTLASADVAAPPPGTLAQPTGGTTAPAPRPSAGRPRSGADTWCNPATSSGTSPSANSAAVSGGARSSRSTRPSATRSR
ncbi:hypothetical protein G7085_09095 [Tessaracoccus sp. HDW20]|uniref:hypothetical protein n=1 Tax=Tessaracoccus coleopterorum TaxID=2714950 RepID=UPI0018D43D61|nr:hypothetical protein [Tessaracoccus coleopterorum]NHB84715.1 hypothetical protein [Tessaracoccus coleopterorum]